MIYFIHRQAYISKLALLANKFMCHSLSGKSRNTFLSPSVSLKEGGGTQRAVRGFLLYTTEKREEIASLFWHERPPISESKTVEKEEELQ